MVRAAIALLMLLLVPSAALAEKRIALLIGNQAYGSEIGRLGNPHNDVALLEKSLKGLGFEVVTVRDAGLAGLHQAINAYARRVQAAGPNAVGFFYYSGHGAADAGTNYLIPVDVKTTETGELWDQSLRLTSITRQLKSEAGNAVHFVIFDACRNTLKLTAAGSRAVVQSKGFVPISQENGMLIAYATAEGELASDRGAVAGPYATVLAEEIVKPGYEAVTMFRRVQVRVRSTIGQEPWLGFSALGEVHLAGLASDPPKPVPAAPAVSEAAREWANVDKINVAALETFVRRHGSSPEADYARWRIDSLKQQVAVATPPKASQPALSKPNQPAVEVSPVAPQNNWPFVIGPARCSGVEALVGNGTRCLKPKDTFKDCPECPEMVVIPAGEFMMGSTEYDNEKPVHKVTIAKPFAVGKFEVTFAEWDACVSAGGCKHKPNDRGWGKGNRPVIDVSWDDITKEYLPWLSRKSGRTYRLLSEAEWEYAARAGSSRKYAWGDEVGRNLANCDGCGSQRDNKQTAPVGSFQPNTFGLHDMHGNVWEWVQDCYKDTYAAAPSDGRATSDVASCSRVLRGGTWDGNPWFLRSAGRSNLAPDNRLSGQGFRVARTLSAP